MRTCSSAWRMSDPPCPAGRRQCRRAPRPCQPRPVWWCAPQAVAGLGSRRPRLREPGVAGCFGLPLALEHHVERRAIGGDEPRDEELVERRFELRRRVGGEQRLGQSLARRRVDAGDRKSTRLNSSHVEISYAVFCLKKKKKHN